MYKSNTVIQTTSNQTETGKYVSNYLFLLPV